MVEVQTPEKVLNMNNSKPRATLTWGPCMFIIDTSEIQSYLCVLCEEETKDHRG